MHRDIKPANILLSEGVERLVITDFGLARAVDDASLTRTGVIAGTPQYMSPEQARGEAVDSRSDLFSLGSVLSTLCTGRPPFRAESAYGILRRITDNEPRPIREINPDVPDWLCAVISRLMSKAAADRYASAAKVAEVLEQCLAHVQQPPTTSLPAECREAADRQQRKRGRSRQTVALVVTGLLCVAAFPLIASWLNSHENPAADTTPPESVATTSPSGEAEASPADVDTTWNSTSAALQSFDQDFTAFQTQTNEFWDPRPPPAPP